MGPDDDIGARVRAARSYADLSQGALADAIGVERRIVGYIEANETRHELTVPEAQRIARACRIPLSFLLHGWAAPAELLERVDALEAEVRSASEDREDLAARLVELDASLERRIEKYVTQVLPPRRSRRPPKDHPKEGGQPAP
jgi:transcriptional regulator with XRE-family HTH domain